MRRAAAAAAAQPSVFRWELLPVPRPADLHLLRCSRNGAALSSVIPTNYTPILIKYELRARMRVSRSLARRRRLRRRRLCKLAKRPACIYIVYTYTEAPPTTTFFLFPPIFFFRAATAASLIRRERVY